MASNTISTTFYIAVSTLTYLADPLNRTDFACFQIYTKPGVYVKGGVFNGGVFFWVYLTGGIFLIIRAV